MEPLLPVHDAAFAYKKIQALNTMLGNTKNPDIY